MVTICTQDFTASHIGQHLCDVEPSDQASVLVAPSQLTALEQSLLVALVQQVEALVLVMRGLQ